MKNIFDQEGLAYNLGRFLEIGRSFFQEDQGLKFLEAVINYLLQATEIETDTIIESITCITTKGGELAMTTAERLRQEGRQEGGYTMILSLVQNAKNRVFPTKLLPG